MHRYSRFDGVLMLIKILLTNLSYLYINSVDKKINEKNILIPKVSICILV